MYTQTNAKRTRYWYHKNHWRLFFITCWLPFQFSFFPFFIIFRFFHSFLFFLLVLAIETTMTTNEKMVQKQKWTTNKTNTAKNNVVICRVQRNKFSSVGNIFDFSFRWCLSAGTNKNLYRCFYCYSIDVCLLLSFCHASHH